MFQRLFALLCKNRVPFATKVETMRVSGRMENGRVIGLEGGMRRWGAHRRFVPGIKTLAVGNRKQGGSRARKQILGEEKKASVDHAQVINRSICVMRLDSRVMTITSTKQLRKRRENNDTKIFRSNVFTQIGATKKGNMISAKAQAAEKIFAIIQVEGPRIDHRKVRIFLGFDFVFFQVTDFFFVPVV